MKTSASDPIRVDFVPVSALGLPGRIGMTFAPGKKAPGIGGSWDRDLVADLDRLRDVYRTSMLVSLVEDDELRHLGITALADGCAALGMQLVRFPIVDGDVPRSLADFDALVERIVATAREGGNVVVHCRGGLGRTGLVAAACLVACGHAPAEAVRLVRRSRPGTVETGEQERFVEEYAALADRRPLSTARPELSRFRGSLLGGALGDALGYPIQFSHRQLQAKPPTSLAPDHHGPAAISDDTQMTLFVAEGVIRTQQRAQERGSASLVNVVQHALLRWLAPQSPRAATRFAQRARVAGRRRAAARAPGARQHQPRRAAFTGSRVANAERRAPSEQQ